jgi:hypothetical protein
MTTNRTPLNRPVNAKISAYALELFEEMERARGERYLSIIRCDVNRHKKCNMTCSPCVRWADAHAKLHEELGLQPWQWPCLPFEVFEPGTAAFRNWRPSKMEYDLWWMLERARRAAAGEPADAQNESGSTSTTLADFSRARD